MNGKIVLVNVKSDRVVHPLGILYIGSSLKKAGFDVKLYNLMPEEVDVAIVEILKQNPVFVGLSVFTGMHTKCAVDMSLKLKEKDKNIKVVWGGVHPSLVPNQSLKEECVDIIVQGEGEETIVELAHSLKDKKDLDGIRGIGYKKNGEIVINGPRDLIKDLDCFKLDWSLIDENECVDIMPDGSRAMLFISSRGCPYNCAFCYNLAFNKRKWRPFSYDYVINGILELKEKTGITGVCFRDDNFMVNKERAFKILRTLKENGITCLEFEMRLDIMTEEILQEVTDLGVKAIFVGWESGSNRILKLINKGIDKEFILKKFKLISKFKSISISAPAIIGFPTETWEEICETIDLGLKISELVPSVNVVFQTFLPYPGTDLYSLAIKEGLVAPKNASDWQGYNTFYGQMKLEWLPWANDKTAELFYKIDKYGKLLNHGKSNSFVRSIGKKVFYALAKFRLKYRFFYLPFEIYILFRFNRYYKDQENNVKKR